MRTAFIERLTKLAAGDSRIMLVTGDLGFGVLEDFARRFPRQFLNVGVAEQNMVGVATGLALEGFVPFCYSIGNFPTLRCLEQIRNDACYHEANVKVVAVGAGFAYGPLGPSHHATEDLAVMRALPNMTVVCPSDAWETAEATSALVAHPGTCYLRLDKSVSGLTPRAGETFQLGASRRLREGDDVTIVGTGGILGDALAAATVLEGEGIRCRVVSMHTLKPLDARVIEQAAAETGGIVVLEEHSVAGGLAGAVAELCMERGIRPRRYLPLGLRAGFSSIVGSQTYLRQRYGLDAEAVATGIRNLLRSNTAA